MFTRILSVRQTKEADRYTIENEPVSSIDLMERAADQLCAALLRRFSSGRKFRIFCGKGNNGGDGLAVARLLAGMGARAEVFFFEGGSYSDDFSTNLERLRGTPVKAIPLKDKEGLPVPDSNFILVDALLGSGLSRPLEGFVAEVVAYLNSQENYKVAIDIPTGLFSDDNSKNDLEKVFRANLTLTLQQPKLSMLHAKTAGLCGEVEVLPIGLHPEFLERVETDLFYLDHQGVQKLFKPRERHTYKGNYGHSLIMAGSRGSMGAALMSSAAAARAGAGLVTVALPSSGVPALHSFLPEAMIRADENPDKLTAVPDLKKYSAVGFGPGVGKAPETRYALEELLKKAKVPLVIDADGLNILSEDKELLGLLPENTILTPHPGEFKRLLGVGDLGWDYLERLRDFSCKYGVITILKDSVSVVSEPGGKLYFTNAGSQALASGGSGDVLTGMLTALAGEGYKLLDAACLGVFLHGRAGTLAGESQSLEAALATDVIQSIGMAYRELYS